MRGKRQGKKANCVERGAVSHQAEARSAHSSVPTYTACRACRFTSPSHVGVHVSTQRSAEMVVIASPVARTKERGPCSCRQVQHSDVVETAVKRRQQKRARKPAGSG